MINGYFLEKDAQIRHREMVEVARLERLIQEANGSKPSRWQKWTRRVGDWLIGLGHRLNQEAGDELSPFSLD